MRKSFFIGAITLLLGCTGGYFIGTFAHSEAEAPSDRVSVVYPVNENGQTYGSAADARNYEEEPDLISAYGSDGKTTGYVKKEDLQGPQPQNPEEAMQLMKDAKPRDIPLYDVDGITVIGNFRIEAGEVTVMEEE